MTETRPPGERPPGERPTYSTTPPSAVARESAPAVVTIPALLRGPTTRRIVLVILGAVALGFLVQLISERSPEPLSPEGQVTVGIFVAAVWAWIFTDLDDTYVSLGAAVALVLTGSLPAEDFFATLGDDTVWLLLGAFVIAAGVTQTGLATRAAVFVIVAARSPRQLFHLLTASLVVTTFAVPSTSGRAALAVPVFIALATALRDRPRLVRAVALLFPTVILLSAVGSLLGAGAHLVTSQVLQTATGDGISFAEWLLLGLPLAVVSSHVAAELVLMLFTTREERGGTIGLEVSDFEGGEQPVSGPLSVAQSRAALLLGAVVLLWCTQSLHGVDPAIVALVGSLVATSPQFGSVQLSTVLKSAPWSLLLFLAATLALGSALVSSGAADWVASSLLGPFSSGGNSLLYLVVVIVLSTLMHLLVQSRSARSSVLVPIVVALAPAAGLSAAAVAFASTAAAGFCHTLTSSAKPVAMFSKIEETPTYEPRDLIRLSAFLAPVHIVTVLAFSLLVWPHLGLPLSP
ncbi:SLC13 family permease [Georgenia alba]|uniref:SLC13 family permease n=1 Tax=Georgenia alba TaxID=2233858 RepID=A0ABW2Q2Y6_9MICO